MTNFSKSLEESLGDASPNNHLLFYYLAYYGKKYPKNNIYFFIYILVDDVVKIMVLKTGLDRSDQSDRRRVQPIRLSIDHDFGLIRSIELKIGRTRIRLVEPTVRPINRSVPFKPDDSFLFFIFKPSRRRKPLMNESRLITT